MSSSIRSSSRSAALRPGPGPHRCDQILLGIIDAGLAGVVFVAPWFMGGRHPLGELVLVLLAVVVALAWSVRQAISPEATAWQRSAGELLLAAGVVLLVLQFAPLPAGLLNSLSPHTSSILPLWTAGSDQPVSLGQWDQVSMTPEVTRAGLILFLAYGMLFIVTLQRIRGVADIERVFHWLALGTILLAVVGLLQYLTSNGKFLWIYQHPFRDTNEYVVGPFINRNHFAQLLALGLGPLLWSIQETLNRRRGDTTGGFSKSAGDSQRDQLELFLRLLGLGIVLFAGLMTVSRGGAAAMFVATAVCLAAFYRAGLFGKKFLLGMASVFLLIGACLFIHGYRNVSNRLSDYTRGSLADLDGNGARRKIWEADVKALPDYSVLGAGVGSHREVYPMYFSDPWETEYTHAECGYLQVALEAGMPGLVLLLSGIALAAVWCLTGLRRSESNRLFVCAAAVAASLAASVVHSVVDFVWYIPACMAVTVLLLACACRLAGFARRGEDQSPAPARSSSRLAFAGWALAVVAAGTWMGYDRFCAAMASPHWDQYVMYSLSAEGKTAAAVPTYILEDLEEIVRWTPNDARAHVRLAGEYLRRFDLEQKSSENVMALSQIRDAAINSRFASRADLDAWLTRAVGPTRRYLDGALWHTRRGLALGPLQGEGYVYLAELCFLQGASAKAKPAYVAQALKVRPHNGKVLFAAGEESALAGDLRGAVGFWKQAFKCGPEEQAQLVDLLVGNHVPAAFLLQNFEPDLPALRLLRTRYTELRQPTELRLVLHSLVQSLEQAAADADENNAVPLDLELHAAYRDLQDPDQALEYLRRAVMLRPNDYDVRFALGSYLNEQHQFAEAEADLNWCAQRRPDDPQLKALLEGVVKNRIDQQARRSEGTRLR